MSKTVAFLGASTGVGLAALTHILAAGHQCIALCRTPSKLTDIFPPTTTPNLKIIEGNAHDISAVSQCIQSSDGKLVDFVITSIGGKPVMKGGLIPTPDDPEVCRKGATVLLSALAELRNKGFTGNPHFISVSTTGLSRFHRDIPITYVPLYHVMLKVPHEDKRIMEDKFAESGEAFTVVRCSLLTNGESSKPVRAGVEDPKTGLISKALGYTISRQDAGKWIADNLVLKSQPQYTNKNVSITY